MKSLHATTDIVFLELLKSKLADEGIVSMIKNVNPPAVGEITPMVAWPELWIIDDQDDEKANAILQESLQKLKASASQESWQCAQCGEFIEPQFDICWQCGNSKV